MAVHRDAVTAGVLCLLLLYAGEVLEAAAPSGFCTKQVDNDPETGRITCNATSVLDKVPQVNISQWSPTVFQNWSFVPGVQVSSIQSDAFSGVPVRELKLGGLNVSSLSPTAFRGVSDQLTDLILEGNNISSIQPGTFSMFGPTSHLSSLSLASNRLSSLSDNTFSNLSTLDWLSLSDNQLTALPDTLLTRLVRLSSIWLDGNKLTSISGSLFRGLTELRWIYLNDNQISTIDVHAFIDQTALEVLFLQNNVLVSLPAGLLVSQGPSLLFIDISNNQLSSLPLADLQNLTAIEYFGMSGNPWTCGDCNLTNWVRQLNSGTDNASCSNGTQLSDPHQLMCPLPSASQYSSSTEPPSSTTISAAKPSSSTIPSAAEPSLVTSARPDPPTSSSSSNLGLIVGVVVGAVVGCGAIIAIIVVVVVIRRRRRRRKAADRLKNFTSFNDDDGNGSSAGKDGAESTRNLVYRLGGAMFGAKKSLFDSNTNQQPMQVPREGTDREADGTPAKGDEDVSVAAKSGMKVVMNTNVVAQSFISKVGSEEC